MKGGGERHLPHVVRPTDVHKEAIEGLTVEVSDAQHACIDQRGHHVMSSRHHMHVKGYDR